jgi:NADH-quinone oxidoreductase subunit N
MNIGIFALIIGFSKNGLSLKYLINWSFLKKWNVILALTFAILFFSVAGIPPLAGFFSKFGIILTLILQENLFTSLMLIIFSCIGCFYYIRLIKIFFFTKASKNSFWLSSPSKQNAEALIGPLLLFNICLFVRPTLITHYATVVGFILF